MKIIHQIVYYLSNDTLYDERMISDVRRRTILLNSVIFSTIITTILFKAGELLINGRMLNLEIIILNVIILSLIHLYFRKTHNLNVASYLITAFLAFAYIVLNNMTADYGFSLLWWSILMPVFAFSQFELRKAMVIITIFYLYIFGYIAINLDEIIQSSFGGQGLMNYFGVLFLTSLLAMNLEKQNADLIQMLQLRTETLEIVLVHDRLTGIYNRIKLDDTLIYEMARTNRDNQPFSVLMLDTDNFKDVNDHFGHLVGDKVLMEIAHIIDNTCRSVDVVGRWGGEEFMVVCPSTTVEGANILAKKIVRNVYEHKFSHDSLQTISIGIAQYAAEDTLDTLVMKADKALYRAKLNGRNRIEIYLDDSNDTLNPINVD